LVEGGEGRPLAFEEGGEGEEGEGGVLGGSGSAGGVYALSDPRKIALDGRRECVDSLGRTAAIRVCVCCEFGCCIFQQWIMDNVVNERCCRRRCRCMYGTMSKGSLTTPGTMRGRCRKGRYNGKVRVQVETPVRGRVNTWYFVLINFDKITVTFQ
jgi:hypothetical protein